MQTEVTLPVLELQDYYLEQNWITRGTQAVSRISSGVSIWIAVVYITTWRNHYRRSVEEMYIQRENTYSVQRITQSSYYKTGNHRKFLSKINPIYNFLLRVHFGQQQIIP